jgi:hypothetical protein
LFLFCFVFVLLGGIFFVDNSNCVAPFKSLYVLAFFFVIIIFFLFFFVLAFIILLSCLVCTDVASFVLSSYNTELLRQLRARIGPKFFAGNTVGDIFLGMRHFGSIYSAFLAGYDGAMKVVSWHQANNPQMAKVLACFLVVFVVVEVCLFCFRLFGVARSKWATRSSRFLFFLCSAFLDTCCC